MYNDFRFKYAAVEERRGVEDFYKQSGNFHGYSDIPSSGLKEVSDEKLSHSSLTENKETLAKSPPGHFGENDHKHSRGNGFLSKFFGGGLFSGGSLLGGGLSGFLGRMQEDDLVLALVFFLIFNEHNDDDWILLIILAALFLT